MPEWRSTTPEAIRLFGRSSPRRCGASRTLTGSSGASIAARRGGVSKLDFPALHTGFVIWDNQGRGDLSLAREWLNG